MGPNLNPFKFKCLNNKNKRLKIFTWLKKQKVQIIFLQETYTSKTEENQFLNDWGGPIYFSHGTKHSKGVMILVQNGFDLDVKKITNDKNGRFIILDTEIENITFIFANVYSPNVSSEQKVFSESLQNYLEKYDGDKIYLGGDFNCSLTSLDKQAGTSVYQNQHVINAIHN